MLAGVGDRAHRLGIAFEARPEGANKVAGARRVDVITLLLVISLVYLVVT